MWISKKKYKELEQQNQVMDKLPRLLEALTSAAEKMDAKAGMMNQETGCSPDNRGYLTPYVGTDTIMGKSEKEDDEKKRAAYALNLCTVSVSQIVDYNDLFILEQEYDTILNNLNLEIMPKDEALLGIIKQVLDVISYFRIQEKEKKRLENQYAKKMKEAIWSATPNFTAIINAGGKGGWAGMTAALAVQVGTGYMNYRKRKAEIAEEKDNKEWEMTRAAMEQFNALRRELFATAWRLADSYQFPDEYRLTERQIHQYNDILMDPNLSRRYERLKVIQDSFEAYPPFWYYFGNTALRLANRISNREENQIEYNKYIETVRNYYNKFIEFSERNNLFRLNQIAASCYIEYVDLLLSETVTAEIRKTVLTYLEAAIRCSGNACDVLQICMVDYLKLNEVRKAEEILLQLVNEQYNVDTNAAFLSFLYSLEYSGADEKRREEIVMEYNNLIQCAGMICPGSLWFHLPIFGETGVSEQLPAFSNSLSESSRKILSLLREQYKERFNVCLPIRPRNPSEYESYFRKPSKCDKFIGQNQDNEWVNSSLVVIDELFGALTGETSPAIWGDDEECKHNIRSLEAALREGLTGQKEFFETRTVSKEECVERAKRLDQCYDQIVNPLFDCSKALIDERISNESDYSQIMLLSIRLHSFCDKNNIEYPVSDADGKEIESYCSNGICEIILEESLKEYRDMEEEKKRYAFYFDVLSSFAQKHCRNVRILEEKDPQFRTIIEREKIPDSHYVNFIMQENEKNVIFFSHYYVYFNIRRSRNWVRLCDIECREHALMWRGKKSDERTFAFDSVDATAFYEEVLSKMDDYNDE